MTKIMKGGIAYNSTANMVALTQAEYDALTTAQKNNGNFYFIIDADPSYFSAENIDYNNTDSGLTATNIQGAVDEVVSDKADRVPEPAEYDPTATYVLGDFCTHVGNIYQATSNTTGAWDYSVWALCTPQQDYLHSINPVGSGSFSLNRKSGTTIGARSFAEGNETTASGGSSHAEGGWTTASGSYSHAEGSYTSAGGWYGAHAEGEHSVASGKYGPHAEGYYTTASGTCSHAEGRKTVANHSAQHVFGEFNIEDPSTASADNRGNYVEIVGNGTADNSRANARTLDWSGNEVLAGGLKINGTQDVATTSSLSTVATSGSYNDLLNKPTIANYGTELSMSSTDSSKVSNRITALETVDYYQVPNAVPDNGTAQIPASVWAHRYIVINIRRYGYFGSMLIRKQNIVEGHCGAGVCIYVSVSPKVFKISETGLFTALQNFGTDGQWVEFIGMF